MAKKKTNLIKCKVFQVYNPSTNTITFNVYDYSNNLLIYSIETIFDSAIRNSTLDKLKSEYEIVEFKTL